MADLPLEESQITVRKIAPFQKAFWVEAGEKITKDADLVAFANKTVPAGKRVQVAVRIDVITIQTV